MGGMFDPVHRGHVLLATRARDWAALDTVRLVPTGTPVHRERSLATAAQRLAMLDLATATHVGLQVDAREIIRDAPSYTYDTASALRHENPNAALFLILGLDAFTAFDTWHRWQDLLGLVHLLVAVRPGYRYESCRLDRGFRDIVNDRRTATADVAAQRTAGRILMAELDLPDISSTQVRRMVRKGEDISALVPPGVADYIAAHKLYT